MSIAKIVSRPPLLATERGQEFDKLHKALEQELKPRGAVEKINVADLANRVWEILRLRRAKTATINLAFKDALFDLLYRVMGSPDDCKQVRSLTLGWLRDPDSRKQVLSILKECFLDESAIEAEAIRRTASDLEGFDRMLTLQEAQLNKVLRAIADYRESFADQSRTASNRLIEATPVIRLERRPAKQ